jgi:antitoxin component YwqK of YwqJK toxin-antitoxin module
VGAGLFGLYGLITGDVPFDSGRAQPRPGSSRPGTPAGDDALADEIEDEIAKQTELEREIEEELKRQEELLAAINQEELQAEEIRRQEEERATQELNRDPLAAPETPYEREIPESLYEVRRVKTDHGRQIHKTLDADRDGRPEIELVFDQKSGEIVSRGEDTNYDGQLDTRNTYENGQITGRSEDTNHDGRPDRWVSYEGGRGERVEVDRDFDGTRDGFQTYSGGWLVLEEHDTNGDGKIDRRVEYAQKRRQVEREDSDHNGSFDIVTYYDAREVPTRVERDTVGDGKVDVWEFYEGGDPSRVVMVRKEEDLTADGSADVKSYYEKGKLIRKEVSDPDLLLQ